METELEHKSEEIWWSRKWQDEKWKVQKIKTLKIKKKIWEKVTATEDRQAKKAQYV